MQKSPARIVLSTHDFHHLVIVDHIIYCQSDNSYTSFHLLDNKKITVSIPLKKIEKQLGKYDFIRSQQSYLVNAKHIKGIYKNTGGALLLSNGITIPVSSRKKKEVLHFLEDISQIQIN